MATRFRKSIKAGKGTKLNLGKKSVGISLGGKSGGVSLNSRSGARVRISIPGTGISYNKKIGSTGRRRKSSGAGRSQSRRTSQAAAPVMQAAPAGQETRKSGILAGLSSAFIGVGAVIMYPGVLGWCAALLLFAVAGYTIYKAVTRADAPADSDGADAADEAEPDAGETEKEPRQQ